MLANILECFLIVLPFMRGCHRSLPPGFIIIGLGADLLGLAIDLACGGAKLLFSDLAQLSRLLTELLFPRRSMSERDQIARSSIQFGEGLSRLGLIDIAPDFGKICFRSVLLLTSP